MRLGFCTRNTGGECCNENPLRGEHLAVCNRPTHKGYVGKRDGLVVAQVCSVPKLCYVEDLGGDVLDGLDFSSDGTSRVSTGSADPISTICLVSPEIRCSLSTDWIGRASCWDSRTV